MQVGGFFQIENLKAHLTNTETDIFDVDNKGPAPMCIDSYQFSHCSVYDDAAWEPMLHVGLLVSPTFRKFVSAGLK